MTPQTHFGIGVVAHDGRFTVRVHITTTEGPFTATAEVSSVPDTRTITTTHGGKTYTVTVNLGDDGAAVARLEAPEGVQTVTATPKTFALCAPRSLPNVRPLGPGIDPPKVISRVEPVRTAEAKAASVAGICVVEVVVGETGDVTDVLVLKPLPFGLDQAAVDAVKQWKFEPAAIDGEPVAVSFHVTLPFHA